MHIKVLIVDDHPVFLAGLRLLLQIDSEIELIGEAKDGQSAVDQVNQLKPDIVIMDINMPGMNGIEATREIMLTYPNVKVLALSIHSGKRFVQGMLNAGASGYLLKDAVPEELTLAIKKLAKGDMYLSSSITSIALSSDHAVENEVSILSTKLHRPRLTKEHVNRSHLIDKLIKNQYKPLTLISAGAGYGKSTLVSSWLEQTKTSYAWVSLSEDDNIIRNFITAIFTSVRKRFPLALEETAGLIKAPVLPPTSIISESLINGLDEIEEEIILVLDDYHLILNKEINKVIDELLRFPPQLMQLVIITRRDPFLDLSSLRAHSRVNNIRMKDLCFTESEIKVLFENILGSTINQGIAHSLYQQTEGWITGLRLASLTVNKDDQVNETFISQEVDITITSDYMVKEVIENLPEHIQDIVIKISLFNRFCGNLIEDVFLSQDHTSEEKMSGEEVIEKLLDYDLFTISLDHDGKWYRFHHLFQESLLKQLKNKYSVQEIQSHQLIASKWYDLHNLKEEAVQFAVFANEIEAAVALVVKYRYELINIERTHELNLLMDYIPEEIIDKNPALLSAKAYYMDFLGRVAEMIEYKDKARAILNAQADDQSNEWKAVRGELAVLDGTFHIVYGDWQSMIECGKEALTYLPDRAERFISNAVGFQVVGCQMADGVEASEEKVKELLIKHPIRSHFTRMGEHLWYSLVFAMQGEVSKLKMSATKLLTLGEKHIYAESIVYGRFFLSYAHFMANEFDLAEPYLKKVVEGSFSIRIMYVAQCAYMLASIYIHRGEHEKAYNLMELVLKKTKEIENENETSVVLIKAMRIDLALKAKDLEKAIELYDFKDFNAILPPLWFPYVPQLSVVKLKLALNTPKELIEALQILQELEVSTRQVNKKAFLIDILILQAVALKAQKNEAAAIEKITEALTLSSTRNYVRSFIDLGSSLQDLIVNHIPKFENLGFVKRIQKAMNVQNLKPDKLPTKVAISSIGDDELDQLTFREIEVLGLVAKGLRNKEISEVLFVQTDTVKKHLKNIYSKLRVPNRWKAVKKAIDLDLIKK